MFCACSIILDKRYHICKPPHKHRIESNEILKNENSKQKEMNKW